MRGKRKRPAAFRVKTVARAAATSSSSARRIGAMAAIALPPQMAVPTAIRPDVRAGTPIPAADQHTDGECRDHHDERQDEPRPPKPPHLLESESETEPHHRSLKQDPARTPGVRGPGIPEK
jgi:hypothetical protein